MANGPSSGYRAIWSSSETTGSSSSVRDVTDGAAHFFGNVRDQMVAKIGPLLQRAPPEPTPQNDLESLWSDVTDEFSCSWKTRVIGFVACFSFGFVLSALSALFVPAIFLGRPQRFAVPYTLGNICSIASSCFLVSPTKHCASMFEAQRWISSTVYFALILMTVVAALTAKSALLTLLLIVAQMGAWLWHSLSYIPYGQTAVVRCLTTCF